MKASVTVEDFLELEEQGRRIARLRAPAREVRRFHAAVRRFATAWCTRPDRRITAENANEGLILNLEQQDRYGWVPIVCLCADHAAGHYFLRGPSPARKETRLSQKLRKTLEKLAKTWRATPGAEPESDDVVKVHLPRLADVSFDRFLDLAIEACSEV